MNNTLTISLVLSTAVHFLLLNPVDMAFNKKSPEVKQENQKIEFEFFQAAPRERKGFFVPQLNTEITPVSSQKATNNLLKNSENLLPSNELVLEDFLEPSFEEQEEIQQVDEKISEILETEVELEQLETVETVKWDYCNRIRSLIENQAKMPDEMKSANIDDVVKVEITVNRSGKLIKNTPRIIKEESSRYEIINKAAVKAVIRASEYFPDIPKRFPGEDITFWLPIRFKSNGQSKD